MSFIGYARVSSYGQSLEVQLEKLAHCDRVFQEKQSARTDEREQLQLCLDYVRDGDSLVITKLDRLARSTRDLLNIMRRLEDKHVKLVVLDQQIDTSCRQNCEQCTQSRFGLRQQSMHLEQPCKSQTCR